MLQGGTPVKCSYLLIVRYRLTFRTVKRFRTELLHNSELTSGELHVYASTQGIIA